MSTEIVTNVLGHSKSKGTERLLLVLMADQANSPGKHLHDRFASKRIRGEWFDLSEDDIAFIKAWDGKL